MVVLTGSTQSEAARGRCHHIDIGRPYAGAQVKPVVHEFKVTIIKATTGEILRQLTIDTTKDYQPTGKTTDHTRKQK